MAVARAFSSQKPGERESWRSVSTLYVRFSTSKKPPQDNYTVPHNLDLFLCHAANVRKKGDGRHAAGVSSCILPPVACRPSPKNATNLISRILFLNYHLSGRAIAGEILLPTLDPDPTWAGKSGGPPSKDPIRGITAPKVYPRSMLPWYTVSFYLTFSPFPPKTRG